MSSSLERVVPQGLAEKPPSGYVPVPSSSDFGFFEGTFVRSMPGSIAEMVTTLRALRTWPLRQSALVHYAGGLLHRSLPVQLPLSAVAAERRVVLEELFYACLDVGDYGLADEVLRDPVMVDEFGRGQREGVHMRQKPTGDEGNDDKNADNIDKEGIVDQYEFEQLDLACPLPYAASLRVLLDECMGRAGLLDGDEGTDDEGDGASEGAGNAGSELSEQDKTLREVRDAKRAMARKMRAGKAVARRRGTRARARVDFTAANQAVPTVHHLRARQMQVSSAKAEGRFNRAIELLLEIIADFGGGGREEWLELSRLYHRVGHPFLAVHAADEALASPQVVSEDPGVLCFVADMHANAASMAHTIVKQAGQPAPVQSAGTEDGGDGSQGSGRASTPPKQLASDTSVTTHLHAAVDLYVRAHVGDVTRPRPLYGLIAASSTLLAMYDVSGDDIIKVAEGDSAEVVTSLGTVAEAAAQLGEVSDIRAARVDVSSSSLSSIDATAEGGKLASVAAKGSKGGMSAELKQTIFHLCGVCKAAKTTLHNLVVEASLEVRDGLGECNTSLGTGSYVPLPHNHPRHGEYHFLASQAKTLTVARQVLGIDEDSAVQDDNGDSDASE